MLSFSRSSWLAKYSKINIIGQTILNTTDGGLNLTMSPVLLLILQL